MLATKYALQKAGIWHRVVVSLILGDDNLTILNSKGMTLKEKYEFNKIMSGNLTSNFRDLGLIAKIKLHSDISKLEFCSMILAPIKVDGKPSFTMIQKFGRYVLSFN